MYNPVLSGDESYGCKTVGEPSDEEYERLRELRRSGVEPSTTNTTVTTITKITTTKDVVDVVGMIGGINSEADVENFVNSLSIEQMTVLNAATKKNMENREAAKAAADTADAAASGASDAAKQWFLAKLLVTFTDGFTDETLANGPDPRTTGVRRDPVSGLLEFDHRGIPMRDDATAVVLSTRAKDSTGVLVRSLRNTLSLANRVESLVESLTSPADPVGFVEFVDIDSFRFNVGPNELTNDEKWKEELSKKVRSPNDGYAVAFVRYDVVYADGTLGPDARMPHRVLRIGGAGTRRGERSRERAASVRERGDAERDVSRVRFSRRGAEKVHERRVDAAVRVETSARAGGVRVQGNAGVPEAG